MSRYEILLPCIGTKSRENYFYVCLFIYHINKSWDQRLIHVPLERF